MVIVNPTAGGGAAGREWSHAAGVLRSELGAFEVAFTKGPGDAGRIAEEEARSGRRLIITFGGDGTISEIAGGVLRSREPVELGLLPQGTGADFLRSLGVPRRLAEAARVLRSGATRCVDAGKVTLTARDGQPHERFFVNSASFGLSGNVAEHANRGSKAWGGRLTFASSTLMKALEYEHPHVWLQIDDAPAIRLPVTSVCFTNGRFFGGGMKIAPDAALDDGRLDIVVIGKLSLWRVVTRTPLLYLGAHLGLPEVKHRLAHRARAWAVEEDRRILVEVDGESPGVLPACFEICPGALRVRVPA